MLALLIVTRRQEPVERIARESASAHRFCWAGFIWQRGVRGKPGFTGLRVGNGPLS